ncbi:MAG: VOC family protein [Terriglobia bacterium]
MAAKPIPEGYHTLTPYLVIKGAAQAIDFYKKAFGAEELFRMPGPDGKTVMHAEIKIGDSIVMLSEEFPGQGPPSPESLGGTPASILIYHEDVDAAFDRAVKAGSKSEMEPQDMFWGDRWGKLKDPFGHSWQVATHKEDLTPEEIGKRAEQFFASMAGAEKK